jgi:hypothetical protein
VQAVLARLNDMSLQVSDDPANNEKMASAEKVHALIEAATDAQNICTMGSAWLPWV